MFERFTEKARQVVVRAQEESRALKHEYIGTEHILLGLLREEDALAARVLEHFDVTIEKVQADVVRIAGAGDEQLTGQIPFTPRAKKVFEHALKEALALGHTYIGTEHILLGLLREDEGVSARIFLDLGLGETEIRNETLRMLSGPSGVKDNKEERLFLVIPAGHARRVLAESEEDAARQVSETEASRGIDSSALRRWIVVEPKKPGTKVTTTRSIEYQAEVHGIEGL